MPSELLPCTRVIFLLSCELAELNMIRGRVWASQNIAKQQMENKLLFFISSLAARNNKLAELQLWSDS